MDGGRSFQSLVKAAGAAYREAVATQVQGDDATEQWDAWQELTAALLLMSWTAGALVSLKAAGVKASEVRDPTVTRFDRVRVGNDWIDLDTRFSAGPTQETVRRFMETIPMTRERWETLLQHAFDAAGELREGEESDALQRILDRSPALAAAVRGQAQRKPEGVNTPTARAVTQGAFFVTSMTQQQVEATKDLLAKVIRQEVTVSVAGKRLEVLGVGDFVEQATLATGTDLTTARLETVYRTNLNRAQTQGRLDICRDPIVRRFVPLMRYNATKDRRTRETHKAMDGFIATTDQIDALGIACPIGFNCRCSWSPVPIAVSAAKGWTDEDGIPDQDAINRHNGSRQALIDKGLVPDIGFVAG
jgi:SPP1 gp7 family putative phage head morphogenesis protein